MATQLSGLGALSTISTECLRLREHCIAYVIWRGEEGLGGDVEEEQEHEKRVHKSTSRAQLTEKKNQLQTDQPYVLQSRFVVFKFLTGTNDKIFKLVELQNRTGENKLLEFLQQ